jgi:hypothetical protein
MAGSYQVVCEANGTCGLPNKPGHLYFSPAQGVTVRAEEQQFKGECEMVADVLRTHVQQTNPAQFREFFAELLACAQLGLVGNEANLSEAQNTLTAFKKRLIVQAGQHFRRRYLNRLLCITSLFAVLFLLSGIFGPRLASGGREAKMTEQHQQNESKTGEGASRERPQPKTDEPQQGILSHSIRNYSFMLATAMLGLWLSFALRKSFTFEQLFLPEADLLGPFHRVIFVIFSTSLIALLCYLKVAGVSVGNFSTQEIPFSAASAILFGALSGVGEALLSDAIVPHVKKVFGGIGRTENPRGI